MSISNISKEHLSGLFLALSEDENVVETIKSNHVHYANLKMIYQQMQSLKTKALNLIEDAKIQNELQTIKKNFKIVSGTTYYVYQKSNNSKYFSLISPEEWESNKDQFLGRYYYDYDKQFILMN